MKTRYAVLFVLAAMLTSCDSGIVISEECKTDDLKCEGNVLYKCTDGSEREDDVSNSVADIKTNSSFTYWKKVKDCTCADDGKSCVGAEPSEKCEENALQCAPDGNSVQICKDGVWNEKEVCNSGCRKINEEYKCMNPIDLIKMIEEINK